MSLPAPYYQDDFVTLYHGDCRELLPHIEGDVLVTDPPYGETNLAWDSRVDGWPQLAAAVAPQLWCFGSLRMFTATWKEFAGWKHAQEIIWSKPRGTGIETDRFSKSHELAVHFYRGGWGDLTKNPPRSPRRGNVDVSGRKRRKGQNNDGTKVKPIKGAGGYEDDGTRVTLTVIEDEPASRIHRLHPTEKPQFLLRALIQYSCPLEGVVLDPFAGSGSTLRAAKDLGRKAIGIELEERYCDIAAQRLAQDVLDLGVAA